MDLSGLSTEDLLALKAGDLSKVSTPGLKHLKSLQAKEPGGEENPGEKELLADSDRAAASFGDEAGKIAALKANGFKEARRNAAGDLIVKGDDGKYYKDATRLTENPINWLEAHAGGALPTAGMVVGGAYGAIPGAAAGSGVGEAARVGLGKLLGTYQGGLGDAAKDVGKETVVGGVSELGGKLIGKIPIPGTGLSVDQATAAALRAMVKGGEKGASRVSQFMTGGDADAFLRQLYRPDQVKNALLPGNVADVAKGASLEREGRDAFENKAISLARQEFQKKFGREPVSTEELIQASKGAVERNAPNAFGESGMTPAELSELEKLSGQSFTTQKEVAPAVKASQVEFQKQPSVLRDASGNPIESVRAVPGQEFTVTPAQVVSEPKQTAGSLQRTADWMQSQVPQSSYDKTLTRSPKSISTYQELLGKLKDKFHQMDPEGLGAADARYHNYREDSELLSPLDKRGQRMSFMDNLFGKNKDETQAAARNIIPKNYERAADIGAAKNLQNSRLSSLGSVSPSGPAIARTGILGAAGAAGLAHNPSLEGLMLGVGGGGALLSATSPKVHQQLYYWAGKYGMPTIQKLIENPQLAPALLDTADLRKLQSIGQNIWSSMKEDRP